MWKRFKIGILIILGIAVAVFTFGKLKKNKLLEKAHDLKKEAEDTYHSTKAEQEQKRKKRENRYENSKENKASLDERLSNLKKNIKGNGTKILIFMIIVLITLPGTALGQADRPLPDTYEEMKQLYFDTLDNLIKIRNERDEAIAIAEGYKKEYENMGSLYQEAEESVAEYEKKFKDLYDTIEKQNEVIKELSQSNGFGILGGVTLTPGDDFGEFKPGLFTGISLDF